MIFSLLIYSLVSAFGDVGKAAAVVIVVLQIAGSSGTYPIELLPEFFQKVYIFFPFPYAINAMRESVAGFYEHDYLIYLLQLCLFIPVSLAIGIWIRRPFKKMNHFMEERMEETEMM
jgi:putative membrane protein